MAAAALCASSQSAVSLSSGKGTAFSSVRSGQSVSFHHSSWSSSAPLMVLEGPRWVSQAGWSLIAIGCSDVRFGHSEVLVVPHAGLPSSGPSAPAPPEAWPHQQLLYHSHGVWLAVYFGATSHDVPNLSHAGSSFADYPKFIEEFAVAGRR